ncbi:MAG: UxaA family hydrolase [Defluviitaleaceae bacterium]|nr:UxaA family hydrolase [Defluviitaleaceae bacterium]
MNDFIKLSNKDNVITLLRNFKQNETIKIDEKNIILTEDIKRGNKVSINNIKKGDSIIKSNFSIGSAINDIAIGSLVHTHNTEMNLDSHLDFTYRLFN